jgi:ATP-binding cassette subfamily B protein
MTSRPSGLSAEGVRPDGQRPADTEVTERTPVPWRRVFGWLLPYWRQELVLLLGMVAGIGLSLLYPLYMRSIVDDVLTAQQTERLLPLVAAILATTTAGVALSAGASWLQTWVTSRVLVDLRLALFGHLQALGPAFFARRRLGDVLSRMGGDLGELQKVATGTLLNVIGSIITLIAVVSALTVLQPLLLVVGAAFVPFALALLWFIRPVIRRLSLRIRERNADISHHMLESLQGLRSVRAHGLSAREGERFGAHNEALVRAVLTMTLWSSGSGAAFQVLVTTNLLAVVAVGIGLVHDGTMSSGDLLAFILFQQRLYGPLQGLSGVYVNLQRASAPIARVFEMLDARTLAPAGSQPLADFDGSVAFEGVTFGWRRPVLQDVSFEVKPGQTVAVVGPSGVGKTTLVDLLFDFVPAQAGVVRLGGMDVRELDLGSVLHQVALVSQEPALFDGTLRDNLRWLSPEVGDGELLEGADAVGLRGWLDSLPEGLDTPLGDRGIRLSSGQRQRIGLARALLRRPRLLVLDEVTAALDWENDRLVREVIGRRRATGATTLAITHRLQLAAEADTVVVLDEGRVAEIGGHGELLAAGGLYARLWSIQRGEG